VETFRRDTEPPGIALQGENIHAKDVASMLVHAQAGNQPGPHTLDLERAQAEDRWRDDGGQG
jgi:hypothetical protein